MDWIGNQVDDEVGMKTVPDQLPHQEFQISPRHEGRSRIAALFANAASTDDNKIKYAHMKKQYFLETIFNDHEMVIMEFLLSSLKFSSMTDREESVAIAHESTCD
ncbi:hypothetical protein BBP40_002321 [Aspergillus hancockii]|nr:hypothetical protein BBP40_002321 [Aspergillus hancockii]